MKLSNQSTVPVYTIAGASTARPLPEWLARKRKRSLKKDPEYASRIELLQDFEFEEASSCVRVSEDGDWVMSTGTYKPQIHTHYLPHLSLSYARHTDSLNQTFVLLSSDYSKSLHLQTDRSLEFHTAGGVHYRTRLPRYGRDLKYNRSTAEALIPTVGVNAEGNGEVHRLNLEIGRFMRSYEVDVGGDDLESLGGGALQGGIQAGAVNCAAVAEGSHGLLAFGTSLGTVEFWDPRLRNRISALGLPSSAFASDDEIRTSITAVEFHPSGLNFATGSSNGIVHTYDLRSPVPLMRKDQGYDYPIQTLKYLTSSTRPSSSAAAAENLILSADKRAIKLWNSDTGDHWTSMEPAVDLNCVEWIPDSGMFLTANEGRQQHAFFIPQLGPAPKWCAFLDNLVEEMAEDAEDPHAFSAARTGAGEVYDNYKFLDMSQLRDLSLDHLIGQTNLLRPYMHGYFVAQKLWEQARLLANPDMAQEQRQKSIQARIDKERESRIRGNKKVAVKVNRKYAEKLAAREEANERRKAQRVLKQGGDERPAKTADTEAAESTESVLAKKPERLLDDPRFSRMFEDEEFQIDEESREFAMHNPSTVPDAMPKKRGLTAVEEDELQERRGSDDQNEDDEESADSDAEAEAVALRARQKPRRETDAQDTHGRISSSSYQRGGSGKANKFKRQQPQMRVSSSNPSARKIQRPSDRSFGEMASSLPLRERSNGAAQSGKGGVVGEKEVTFAPSQPQKGRRPTDGGNERTSDRRKDVGRGKDRRSASGNVFRKM
ncbi:hypothetical protein BAUCODRAFT_64225 [Baudoinia panamericana UAMH 10762]|uniref:Uncharacterized protein n=1 Tax=Baudoinia panamericana (strain UAMH 10762) TaxID=717646 RepID=M2MRS3_BAUPA|nr:uncharacterized protein BAUCODRAFT_64225 [Baudoinia panamericana UAMH 10762]EMC99516.1 hypothetical protein BAUCODRAFT_64225 [Baudoinia panamericana UAMH 10762]